MRDSDPQAATWRRPAALASFAGSAAALALGIGAHVGREGRAHDFNERCYHANGLAASWLTGVDCQGPYDGVQSAERLMWIGYLGAAVLGGAGVALWLTAPRRAPSPSSAMLRCAPALGLTGAICAGRF